MNTQWFLRSARASAPKSRLFCLPYAGGSAAVYRGWSERLPADVEVLSIQLPGRGWRIRETPLTDLGHLADQIADELRPLTDVPFVVFGHSMGSWLGLEVVRRLEASGDRAECFFASGRQAPSLGCTQGLLSHLPDDEFVREVQRRYDAIPVEILREPDVLALLLPALRCDMAALERYRYAKRSPITTPIVAVVGNRDVHVPLDQVAPWALETSGGFTARTLPGDHFYFQADPKPLLALIQQQLTKTWSTVRSEVGAA